MTTPLTQLHAPFSLSPRLQANGDYYSQCKPSNAAAAAAAPVPRLNQTTAAARPVQNASKFAGKSGMGQLE